MNFNSPIRWIAAALILAVAAPAFADDGIPTAPRVDKRPRTALKRGKRVKKRARKRTGRRAHRRDPAKFRHRVLTRLGKMSQRIDKAAAKKRLPPKTVARMRKVLRLGRLKVETALDKAVADGTLRKGEARRVRQHMKALRKALRRHHGKVQHRGKRGHKRRHHKAHNKRKVRRSAVRARVNLRAPFAAE
ncbi:MAG TPA: hypothetical protein ENK23_02840 [Sorangium sp.]|nr:hypothetical protein [Sorangium sp.]